MIQLLLIHFLITILVGVKHKRNDFPKALDWSRHPVGDGLVDLTGPIHYEGECGACWAIGVAVVMDTKFNMAVLNGQNTTTAIELSDQNLVHCAVGLGCDGGVELDAANYAITNGITTEQCYPYDPSFNLACEPDKICGHDKPMFYAKRHREILPADGKDRVTEDEIIAELQNGPVCADIDSQGDATKNAHGGILLESQYTDEEKEKWDLYASVVIVGYGEEEYPVGSGEVVKWWKIKNSWGVGWGDDGYQKVQRGVNLLLIEDVITTIDIDLERSWGFGYKPKPDDKPTKGGGASSLDVVLVVVVGVLAGTLVVLAVSAVAVYVAKRKQLETMRNGGLYGKMEMQQSNQTI